MFFLISIFLTNFYLFLYGLLINKFVFRDFKNSKAEIAIFGCIFVSFVGLLINFFASLNIVINTFIFIIPFLFFFKDIYISKKDIIFVLLTSIFTCFIIAYSNINTPDAGLYHLPFTKIINESKIIIGLSNIHFRFGHVSIIQYLSGINFNFINGVNGILIPLASLMSFIFFYFLKEIINFLKSEEYLKINALFCLLVTCYISYKINRYSGFGNDATSHLLFFYLISIYLKSDNNYTSLNKTFIISTYIFLNKVTLIFAFVFPLIIFLRSKEKNHIFLSFGSILLVIWLIKNIITSSCFIFPMEKTCFNNLLWSNNAEVVKQSVSGEAWAKGWPDRTNIEINQNEFNKDFKWLSSWSSVHLKYIIKILIPFIVFISIIILLINFFKKKKFVKFKFSENEKFKVKSTIFILIFSCCVFFFKFPLYRYGYSYIVSLIILLSIILIFKYEISQVKRIFSFMLAFSFVIIFSKQLIRINENFGEKSIWPNIYSSSIEDKKFIETRIYDSFNIYVSKTECFYTSSPCTNIFNSSILHKKILGYDIIYLKN